MSKEKQSKTDKIIRSHMMVAMGAGLVPVPMLDVVAVTAVQIDMLKQLARHYSVDFDEQSGKSWISAIGGSLLARMGASTMKAIPVIGSILGGVTMSALSGASTYALGTVFNEHFKGGGDLSNINVDDAKKFFQEKFEEGKKMAKEMDEKMEKTMNGEIVVDEEVIETETMNKVKSPVEQLKSIAKMKESGLLTDEEFETMKKKIMDQ